MRGLPSIAFWAAALVCTSTAHAAGRDERALAAGSHAMNDLFASAKFDAAKAELSRAVAECRGCANGTLAKLHVDLGIVAFTAFQDSKKGTSEFAIAKKLDPTVTLDPVFTTPDVQAAFDAAAGHGNSVQPANVVLEDEPDDSEGPVAKKHVAHEEPEPPPEDERASTKPTVPAPRHSTPRVWLTLGLIQDVTVVSGSNVCDEQSQVHGSFVCLRASGSQYHGTPLAGAAGNASGVSFATTRVAFASYFPLWSQVSAGLRIAYAVAGQGPRADGGPQFIPLQVEAQGAYWFSHDAFSSEGVGPFAELSGGVAEIDGSAKVTVKENTAVPPPPNQLDNPPVQSLDAYRKSGSGFVSAGIGAFFPFAEAAGVLADLRASALFPSPGFAMSLGLSGALGL